MVFDERYVPLLRQANMLAIAEIIRRGMPVFNTMTTGVLKVSRVHLLSSSYYSFR
jgi:hypothetical protein